jgi:signal transduction histidine kinase
LRSGLELQQRVYTILDGLNIAVIEIEHDQNRISFSNVAGFKLLQTSFSMNNPRVALPKMLQRNEFLKSHLMQEKLSDVDLALQS